MSTPDPEPAPGTPPGPSGGSARPEPASGGSVPAPTVANVETSLRHRVSEVAADRVLTLPNVISIARLAGVPLFIWLMLGPHADGWAVAVLMASGITDWLDGKTARWLNQYSVLGELLDPVADRLYILATLGTFLVRGIVPWWVVALLIGRDLVLTAAIPLLRSRRYRPLPVLYLGKAATFNLLYAFPLLLLGRGETGLPPAWVGPVQALGYAFTVWGVGLYMWSGVVYVVQIWRAMRRPHPSAAGDAARLSG